MHFLLLTMFLGDYRLSYSMLCVWLEVGGVVAQPGYLVQRCRVVQKCEDTMVSRN